VIVVVDFGHWVQSTVAGFAVLRLHPVSLLVTQTAVSSVFELSILLIGKYRHLDFAVDMLFINGVQVRY
jgi:hypothetical protein